MFRGNARRRVEGNRRFQEWLTGIRSHRAVPGLHTLPVPVYNLARIAAREVEVRDRYSEAHFEFGSEE